MNDPTAPIREAMIKAGTPHDDLWAELQAAKGQVWNTDEMLADFDVLQFQAPFVIVVRKSDNQLGSLEFTHRPRFYFSFRADS
jgi:hypothetical protein